MKRIVVTTANQFTDNERMDFEKKLRAKFGDCVPEYHVDEELIGGVIIFDGTVVYDGSLKNRLKKISDLLKKD